MKKLWIIFWLILGLLSVNREISAQAKYKVIQAPSRSSVELKIPAQPAIQNVITYYQGGGRITMETGLANSGLHQKMIRRIFREEGIPENLAAMGQTLWMAGIETPDSLWLFDDKTAAGYGLKITKYVDERLSFEKATRATAQYLKYLSKKYSGNWELALAAYISGEQNVDRAIQRAGNRNFWKIYKDLPREAQDFVPNVWATILIANNPPKYAFENPPSDAAMVYDAVRVPALTSLDLIAQFSDSKPEDIKRLNPELISNSTPPEPYVVRIPAEKSKIFAERLMRYSKDKQAKP